MSRKVTIKRIQILQECACGQHQVSHETLPIRFCDFKKAGIKIRKDKATGERFFTQHTKCDCQGTHKSDLN